jgi:MFS family permease
MHPALQSRSAFARWSIVAMLMGWTGLGHFCRINITVAGDEVFVPILKMDETSLGYVYTAFGIAYTGLMIPGGWLIDRIGAARALMLLGLFMGTLVAVTGGVGLIPTIASSPMSFWLALLVVRSLVGVCSSPLHPACAHVVSDVIRSEGRSTANGLVTAGALVGIAITHPLFGALMGWITWPWAFVASGLVLFLYGVVWGLTIVPGFPKSSSHETTVGVDHLDAAVEEPVRVTSSDVRTLLTNGNFWLVTLSYALYSYFQYLFFYWIGYYFKQVLKVPIPESREATCIILLSMGGGMIFGGLCTDVMCRLLGTTSGRRSVVMTGTILAGLFGWIAVQVTTLTAITMFLSFSMAALGMCEGVFWTTATDLGGKARGFAGAFMNTVGNIGGFISPSLTPFLARKLQWSGAITVACVISVLSGLTWLAIRFVATPIPREGLLALEENDSVEA